MLVDLFLNSPLIKSEINRIHSTICVILLYIIDNFTVLRRINLINQSDL
jgi:hypothetical protein